jgi:hypothetical protein
MSPSGHKRSGTAPKRAGPALEGGDVKLHVLVGLDALPHNYRDGVDVKDVCPGPNQIFLDDFEFVGGAMSPGGRTMQTTFTPVDVAIEALVAIVVGVALALVPLKQVPLGWTHEWTVYDPIWTSALVQKSRIFCRLCRKAPKGAPAVSEVETG